MYDLLKPRVTRVVVGNPRKSALLKDGSKSDRIDANKLSEQLYMNNIKSVYHGGRGLRTLKELARSYLTVTKDLTRVMNRLKALYRGWAIPCAGKEVYAPRYRAEWLGKISDPGVGRRAEFNYQQLDSLLLLRQEVRRDLLLEVKKHEAWKLLRQIPGIGPIRAAHGNAIQGPMPRFIYESVGVASRILQAKTKATGAARKPLEGGSLLKCFGQELPTTVISQIEGESTDEVAQRQMRVGVPT